MSKLSSFSDARKALVANLNTLLTQFNYTATTFSMRLNQSAFASGSLKHVATAEEVASWISGTKVPSLYAIYKITGFFNISIDGLLSPDTNLTNVAGKSFARQTAASPKIAVVQPTVAAAPITNVAPTKGTTMTKAKSTTNTNAKMRDLIKTRTTSTEYNLNLAYRVLNSDMQIKDIASKTGVSTRSMRDYMYYNTSIDTDVARNLAAVLKTNTAALGLKLNKETMRYEHVK